MTALIEVEHSTVNCSSDRKTQNQSCALTRPVRVRSVHGRTSLEIVNIGRASPYGQAYRQHRIALNPPPSQRRASGGLLMSVSVHNPDQYMVSLRQVIAQGRKRIGLLIGAGAPAGIFPPGSTAPLIPAVAGLTTMVIDALKKDYEKPLAAVVAELDKPNIETILSRVRTLGSVLGKMEIHGLDGAGFKKLSESICDQIGQIVNKPLHDGPSPYTEFVSWISGTPREHAVEVFTTNYDLLFEQAFERLRVPFFDGFSGSSEPFFDPSTVAGNDLPARWTRLWKLHGSLGWSANARGEVVRTGNAKATHLVFPEHLKYDQTQKAPYAALFDRLRAFLMTPDTLLIATGFSFADAHISARIDECLAANPSASVFAFQFKPLDQEVYAAEIAARRANMSLYCPDKAVINGVAAPWVPGDLPTRDWSAIRATYWSTDPATNTKRFELGRFDRLARFFASSRASQQHQLPPLPSDTGAASAAPAGAPQPPVV